jgi:hypothetical protein
MRPAVLALVLLASCSRPQPPPVAAPPKIVLWVWDRAEDLRFLKPGEADVAALMATIYLRNGRAESWHRKLPLHLPEGLKPLSVVRLESDGSALPPADAVQSHLFCFRQEGLQLDFDFRASQLVWYRDLLRSIKSRGVNLSMTAVASACMDTAPAAEFANETVPMLFRMGPQRNAYLARLQKQGAFAPGCRDSLGISIDEPLPWRPAAKRIYVFNPNRWSRESFDQIRARLR